MCGSQRCGLGLPGSAGSLGSADGDAVEASSRNLIQAALLVCCRGKRPARGRGVCKMVRQMRGRGVCKMVRQTRGKYRGLEAREAEFRSETSEMTSEFGTLTLVSAIM